MTDNMFDQGKYELLRQGRVHRPEPVDTSTLRHVDRIDKYEARKGNVEVDRNYTADNPPHHATGPGSTTPTAPRPSLFWAWRPALIAAGFVFVIFVIAHVFFYLFGGTK